MVRKTVTFRSDDDLPMNAVAVLIQKASTFRSTIWLYSGERRANAKSLLGVMSLGIMNGMELECTAEGPDEEEAIKAITEYLNQPEY